MNRLAIWSAVALFAMAATAQANEIGNVVDLASGGTMSSAYFARVDLYTGHAEERSIPNPRIEPAGKPAERSLQVDSAALNNIRAKLLLVLAQQKARSDKEDAAIKAGKMPEWRMQCPPDSSVGVTFRLDGEQGHFEGSHCRTETEMELANAIWAAMKPKAR